MSTPSATELRYQIVEIEHEHANALREIDQFKRVRRELLLRNASDKEISSHDASVARVRRVVDRCDIQMAELQKALAAAEQAERERAVADLREHALRLSAQYKDLAENDYVKAARALVNVLSQMDKVRVDYERASSALPASSALARLEDWRRVSGSDRRLADFAESVRLPPLRQGERPMWSEESRAPMFTRPFVRAPEPARPAWNPPPAAANRPDEARHLAEIHARAHRDGRRTTNSPE